MSIKSVCLINNALEVKFENGITITFEECWLRDHCRCPSCYHEDTFQRAHHILDIPESKVVHFSFTDTHVVVMWDDNHQSKYDANFLAQFEYQSFKDRQRLKPVLWHGSAVADKVSRIQVDKFLNSVEGASEVFQSLLNYGVALIEGVDPSLEATQQVCEALGGVQHTIFGSMWQFTTKADHADTAYTNLPLAAHNDNTYFTEAAGARRKSFRLLVAFLLYLEVRSRSCYSPLCEQWVSLEKAYNLNIKYFVDNKRVLDKFWLQILHCIEHSGGTGGETVLVDGFYGANQLKAEFPEDFEFLTNFDLEAEYIEEGHHHKYSAPIINIDRKSKDLKQIRFNVYDRAPMAFADGVECRNFYRSLRNLARYYQNPENQWQFKLKPGTVIAMDNFRVLHGRTGFSGKRVLCGSYVARSDWLDKARTLRLIQ